MFKLFTHRGPAASGPTVAYSKSGIDLRFSLALTDIMKQKEVYRLDLYVDDDTHRIALKPVAEGDQSCKVAFQSHNGGASTIKCAKFISHLRNLGYNDGRWAVQWNEGWKQFEISLSNDRIVSTYTGAQSVRTQWPLDGDS